MKLHKGLNLLHVFAIATGAMISSGIFVLPGLAFARAGPAVVVSYLLAGVFAVCGMLSIAELATAMPRAGGDYFFVARGFGPAAGTVSGLLSWFALSLKSAFALVGMAAFGRMILNVDFSLIALGLCVVFLVVNVVGVRAAGRVQVGLVVVLLVLMVLYVLRALPAIRLVRFEPFASEGWLPVVSTAGFVFVSFGGLLKVASVAEEVEDPARNIPTGMIVSLVVVSLVYAAALVATVGVLKPGQLSSSLTPITDGARAFLGSGGGIVLGVAAVLAFVSTANAGMMAASRYLLALSRDGLLPGPFGRVGERFKTPHVALLATAALMGAVLHGGIDGRGPVPQTRPADQGGVRGADTLIHTLDALGYRHARKPAAELPAEVPLAALPVAPGHRDPRARVPAVRARRAGAAGLRRVGLDRVPGLLVLRPRPGRG
jgi:amino acid transporter